jgi:hypothetical protein
MPSPPVAANGRPARERILVIGGTGDGKTSALLSIAAWHQKRGSDARFYVVSSGDLAYEQMLSAPAYEHLTNVEYEDCFEYPEWMDVGRGFLKAAKKRAEKQDSSEDWLVVDLYSSLWTVVQDYYITGVRGEDGDDFWTAAAKSAEGSNSGWALYEDINWQVANKLYREFSQRVMGRWPGHVLAISAVKPVDREKGGKVAEGDANIAEWFGRLGVKPGGQKDMAYEFRDIVLTKKLANGGFTLTTAKARERDEVLKGEGWDRDFYQKFLMKVCGWKP